MKIKGGPFDKDQRGEQLSKGQVAALRRKWWEDARDKGSFPICWLGLHPIMDFTDLVVEHKVVGKMGQKRNSEIGNLAPACWSCNNYKGSRRDIEKVKEEIFRRRNKGAEYLF